MPSIYAHRRFGNSVLRLLPQEIAEEMKEYYDYFALGLHGPDPLFYYKPFSSNPINAQGYAMHEAPANGFFAKAKSVYDERGGKRRDRAYLYGFLCHFALDSECHGVVNAQMKALSATHSEVESAFEYFLLERDGKDPLKTETQDHLHPTEKVCDVAAAYFGIEAPKAEKAIVSMKRYIRLLRAPNPVQRGLICFVLKISGNREIRGMLTPRSPDPKFKASNEELKAGYNRAANKAVALIENYGKFLTGEGKLSDKLDRNYE